MKGGKEGGRKERGKGWLVVENQIHTKQKATVIRVISFYNDIHISFLIKKK